MAENSLVKVDDLYKEFPIHKGFLDQLVIENGRFVRKYESVKALTSVRLEVLKGESLCVVG